jgi:hypothetical protein
MRFDADDRGGVDAHQQVVVVHDSLSISRSSRVSGEPYPFRTMACIFPPLSASGALGRRSPGMVI